MTVISLKDVHKKYPLGKTEVHAVKGVSFDIESGDFISIAGPSGSGKSTILNMIGCIDTPSVLNVFENIEFPMLLGKNPLPKAEREVWISQLMEEVGLGDWKTHKPNELSGGQRQRVAIARALVTKPQIVLADEPTANLDSETGSSIIELMKKMNNDYGTTFIFSTHDQTIVDIADHVIQLKDGKIVENRRR
jgi:putative ABC transport system ATP-binding protein